MSRFSGLWALTCLLPNVASQVLVLLFSHMSSTSSDVEDDLQEDDSVTSFAVEQPHQAMQTSLQRFRDVRLEDAEVVVLDTSASSPDAEVEDAVSRMLEKSSKDETILIRGPERGGGNP